MYCRTLFLGLIIAGWPIAGQTQSSDVSGMREAAIPALPQPDSNPLMIDMTNDPVALYLQRVAPEGSFARYVNQAVLAHPSIDEAVAGIAEAEASRREARSGLFPTIDVGLSTRTSIARNFSNDPDNILERSRASGRTDATFSLNQTVLDFGATSFRISAASARLRAAGFEVERQTDEIALRAIAAWYDVYTYRVLVQFTEQFIVRQQSLRSAMEVRVRQGVSAQSDVVSIDNLIAASQTGVARYRRELANAEASFMQLFETSPPADLAKPPAPTISFASLDAVRAAALANPVVDLVEAQARAARQDSRAVRSDTLPRVTAGVEGGRFGVFENASDYDVRGVVNMQYRIFGAADARADQARARAQATDARATRVREEAIRLAVIAWTDVESLEQQLTAAEQGYLTARQSRDVVLARFAATSGTLFNVIDAERRYSEAATAYVAAVTELGAARYILLSRTGRLLETLGIETPASSNYRLGGP